MKLPEFSVPRIEWNSKAVYWFDIFTHSGFLMDIGNFLNKNPEATFEETKDVARKSAMYCFWSKCEYEILITPWPPCPEVTHKIDVFDFVSANLNLITEKIISSKKEILSWRKQEQKRDREEKRRYKKA